MKIKFKFIVTILFIVFLSFYTSDRLKQFFLDVTDIVLDSFSNAANYSKNAISVHFEQAQQISALKEENEKLLQKVALLDTYSYELNSILKDMDYANFAPIAKKVKLLGYAQLGDHYKIWIDFKEFDKEKIYGLISDGKTAGIVINQDNRPLAILQNDPKSVFAVYIGEDKIPGIAKGNGKNIEIKYIAKWLMPKIGDEVRTSGLDEVFLGGTLVGKVVDLVDETLYTTAIVEPAVKINTPTYLYIITKG